MSIALVTALLERRIGLDPGSLGAGAIPRAVEGRRRALGLAGVAEYAALVAGHPGEFQALVEDDRREMALRLLDDTDASVTEIALALDYSETSAFTRAFRRWQGISLAQWRSSYKERENPGQPAGIA